VSDQLRGVGPAFRRSRVGRGEADKGCASIGGTEVGDAAVGALWVVSGLLSLPSALVWQRSRRAPLARRRLRGPSGATHK